MWERRPVHKHPNPERMLAFMRDAADRAAVERFANDFHWDATILAALEHDGLVAARPDAALVLLDCDLTADWRRAVRELARRKTPPCVVLVSTVSDDYLFEEIVKQGGFDVIVKPLHADDLRRIVRLALAYWKNRVSAESRG